MTQALLMLDTKLNILYNRIKVLNNEMDHSDNYKNLKIIRNEYIDQMIIFKRQRNRLLGIIKE